MRAALIFLLLGTLACSSAPRIEAVELTRDDLRLGEEAFLTARVLDDEGELEGGLARVTLFASGDDSELSEEVPLVVPGQAAEATVVLGLSFSGAVTLGPREAELVIIDGGGAESEPWPLSLRLTF